MNARANIDTAHLRTELLAARPNWAKRLRIRIVGDDWWTTITVVRLGSVCMWADYALVKAADVIELFEELESRSDEHDAHVR